MTRFLLSFALQTPPSKTKLSRFSLNLLASWISLLSEWCQPTGHPFTRARQLSHKSCSLFRLQGLPAQPFSHCSSSGLHLDYFDCLLTGLSSISLLSIYFPWGCRRNISWPLAHCYFAQGQKPSSLTRFSLWADLDSLQSLSILSHFLGQCLTFKTQFRQNLHKEAFSETPRCTSRLD